MNGCSTMALLRALMRLCSRLFSNFFPTSNLLRFSISSYVPLFLSARTTSDLSPAFVSTIKAVDPAPNSSVRPKHVIGKSLTTSGRLL